MADIFIPSIFPHGKTQAFLPFFERVIYKSQNPVCKHHCFTHHNITTTLIITLAFSSGQTYRLFQGHPNFLQIGTPQKYGSQI